ncbi:MAG: 16S rRNA (cytosine(1402)-N(4))-methyltransferase RsmH [Pseudomonadota bacterium]
MADLDGHIPVMLPEVLEALSPGDGEVFVDGTFGAGGYTRAILRSADCRVLAIDRDLDAIKRAEGLASEEPRFVPLFGRFGHMDALLRDAGVEIVDGVVLDIGVSSFHLDEADRGFSFQQDGPLDMRMGQSGPTAADVVNHMGEKDLADIFYRLGEEQKSRRVAKRIVERRAEKLFETTLDLAERVDEAVGGRRGAKIHPATKVFQAIRIFVNDELGELGRALVAAERLLKAGGRLVIVTFHSLEDRIVKSFMRSRSGIGSGGSRHSPERPTGAAPSFELVARRAISASTEEAERNPRARSARLRVARRTDAAAWGGEAWPGMRLPSLSKVEIS